jgi:hypothetical protein
MTCALIVFYVFGRLAIPSNLPPIRTTYFEAVKLLHDDSWVEGYYQLGVYPIIKPCEERT